ncbi:hypothetical protein [Sulfolobus polyhedral virus 1]|uniref:Uncharacterized protein n=2 Tax=Alphaportoglobovirus TaxID=2169647 RepID=A0A1W6I141_SPV1|nr:hypothetical protein DT302_gp03 [Sulfolobus polyhedral virus 1]YP_010084253.1 hypothetical protein KM458_gp03 [Sulfolobus polyhedral virus 2]ARM37785.1 hypothetical protein [Sulfolobus polyhedral virus 1]AZI76002.1 hypothetical protein SPV2_gp03 [Sulfolobus polyhedral virus 2]
MSQNKSAYVINFTLHLIQTLSSDLGIPIPTSIVYNYLLRMGDTKIKALLKKLYKLLDDNKEVFMG